MLQPHQEFNEDHTPVGYLITFRSYGTWLHGDRPRVSGPLSPQVRYAKIAAQQSATTIWVAPARRPTSKT